MQAIKENFNQPKTAITASLINLSYIQFNILQGRLQITTFTWDVNVWKPTTNLVKTDARRDHLTSGCQR